MNPDYQVARVERDAYKWAYEYLQDRMRSIGCEGWAADCDGEIEARIEAAKKIYYQPLDGEA